MEIERAIEILNPTHREHYESLEPVNEACRMGMEALKKQIPEPLNYEGDGYDPDGNMVYDIAACPGCGDMFEYGANDWGSKYCPNCGQALDWDAGREQETEDSGETVENAEPQPGGELKRYKVRIRYEVKHLNNPPSLETESMEVAASSPREAVERVEKMRQGKKNLHIMAVWQEENGIMVTVPKLLWGYQWRG